MKVSRGAILLAVIFFGVALYPVVSGAFTDDREVPPPPVEVPSPSTSASVSANTLPPLPELEGPPPRAVSYASLQEMTAALESKGLGCSLLDYLDQEDPTLKEFALCDIGSDQRRVDLYLYENWKLRNFWVPSIRDTGLPFVYGPNWIVVVAGLPETAEERAALIRLALGGKILQGQQKG